MTKQEDFQNRVLARLLTERGVPANFEQRSGCRQLDVVADVEELRIVLEAETGFTARRRRSRTPTRAGDSGWRPSRVLSAIPVA